MLHLKSNRKFLDTFECVESANVLYYDLENSLNVLKERLIYGLNGMGLKAADVLNNGFKFEKTFNKSKLKEEIKKCEDYDIIVLDSYRRFLDGDENKSEHTNKFYVEFIKPLIEANKTVITIMHEKKGGSEESTYIGADLEMIRGSGDIGAQVDLAFQVTKIQDVTDIKTGNPMIEIFLNTTKNRRGFDFQPFKFKVIKHTSKKTTTIEFSNFGKPKRPKDRALEKISEYLTVKGPSQLRDIIEYIKNTTSYSEVAVKRFLKEMTDESILEQPTYGMYKIS